MGPPPGRDWLHRWGHRGNVTALSPDIAPQGCRQCTQHIEEQARRDNRHRPPTGATASGCHQFVLAQPEEREAERGLRLNESPRPSCEARPQSSACCARTRRLVHRQPIAAIEIRTSSSSKVVKLASAATRAAETGHCRAVHSKVALIPPSREQTRENGSAISRSP
jgi:hypothetical protein